VITYRELDSILRRFNYGLTNPKNAYIDIIRFEEEISWKLLSRRKSIVKRRIARIPFPGWNREICVRDLKKVRKATDLTASNGVDSEVFFRDADPLQAFVSKYQGPLKRLAKK
jgi:hypothetical protein